MCDQRPRVACRTPTHRQSATKCYRFNPTFAGTLSSSVITREAQIFFTVSRSALVILSPKCLIVPRRGAALRSRIALDGFDDFMRPLDEKWPARRALIRDEPDARPQLLASVRSPASTGRRRPGRVSRHGSTICLPIFTSDSVIPAHDSVGAERRPQVNSTGRAALAPGHGANTSRRRMVRLTAHARHCRLFAT